MNWILGIRNCNGQSKFEVLEPTGAVVLRDLSFASMAGIEIAPRQIHRHSVVTDTTTWRAVAADAYLKAMGFELPTDVVNQQTVFEFCSDSRKHGKIRFFIPAVVWMRAVFRPERFLLPAMFGVQALDRACFLDFSATPPRPVVHDYWGSSGFRCVSEPVLNVLQWLLSYGSARRMADSIYIKGMNGHVGCDLPKANVNLTLSGRQIGDVCFVTRIHLSWVEPTELPIYENSPTVSRIYVDFKTPEFSTTLHVVPTTNGRVITSDEEWFAVEPIILAGLKKARIQINQRHFFDGILQKISTNTPWRKVVCPVGGWSHLQRAYTAWTKSGTLAKAITVLNGLREFANDNSSREIGSVIHESR